MYNYSIETLTESLKLPNNDKNLSKKTWLYTLLPTTEESPPYCSKILVSKCPL